MALTALSSNFSVCHPDSQFCFCGFAFDRLVRWRQGFQHRLGLELLGRGWRCFVATIAWAWRKLLVVICIHWSGGKLSVPVLPSCHSVWPNGSPERRKIATFKLDINHPCGAGENQPGNVLLWIESFAGSNSVNRHSATGQRPRSNIVMLRPRLRYVPSLRC